MSKCGLRLTLLISALALAVSLLDAHAPERPAPRTRPVLNTITQYRAELNRIRSPLATNRSKEQSARLIADLFRMTCSIDLKQRALFALRWTPTEVFHELFEDLIESIDSQPPEIRVGIGYCLYSVSCRIGGPIVISKYHLERLSRLLEDNDLLVRCSFSHLCSQLHNVDYFEVQIARNLAVDHESVADSALLMADRTNGVVRQRLGKAAFREVLAKDSSSLACQSALRFCLSTSQFVEFHEQVLEKAIDSRFPEVVLAALSTGQIARTPQLIRKLLIVRSAAPSKVSLAIDAFLKGTARVE